MNLRKVEKSLKNNLQPIEDKNYPLIISVECNKEEITAFLEDGRKFSIPTARYPRTRKATLKQLKNFRISSDKYGIHWPEIDEHLSVRAFLNNLAKINSKENEWKRTSPILDQTANRPNI